MVGSKHQVTLKLDDGSIIGHDLLGDGSGPVKVSFLKAVELNKAGEKDFQRLEQLVATARSLLPKANGAAQHTPLGGPAKRARVDSGHLTDAMITGDWVAKCKVILDKVAKSLGTNKNVFWNAVNPTLLPDYYNIVKKPMFMGSIENSLVKHKYSSPSQFNADMRLAFANCKLYNPIGDPFRKIGEKVEEVYEQLWVASGLADTETMEARGKRATAGIARPKYEPEKFEAAATPHQGAKAPKQPGSAKAGAKGGSLEVTSGGRGGPKEAPISDARKHEMGELLLSEEMGPHMEALTNLLPPEMLEGADGEFELDFENLDDVTIRKIDDFLRSIFGPPAEEAAASPPASPPGDDDDEVSEGDLDDADDSDDD